MAETVTIVGGCGHVGLPLGIALASAGATVTLVDTDELRVRAVLEGQMPFFEFSADEALPRVRANHKLSATTDPRAIATADAVIVTIGTPVDEFLDPKVSTFDRAMDAIIRHTHDGQLLVLRSTVFPGVTQRLEARLAETGPALDVAYCPERIAQAYALLELPRLPQLIGATRPVAFRRASALFRRLGTPVIEVQPIEAELAKLFANSYRYINFAISNQFYMIAQRFGADFHRIYEAVTYGYPRLAGLARAGFAGGPCLLKDTMQLAAFNHNNFALGQAAMMVNEGLPRALVDAVKSQRDLSHLTAGILGMAFKGNCDDHRDSLAYKLRKVLTLECRKVLCTDPYIFEPGFVSLEELLAQADILFLGACHDQYRDLVTKQPVVDVFGFMPKQKPSPELELPEAA